MNTQLLETTSTTREHERSSESHQTRQQTQLDRLAMRLGLALLVWSRRTLRRLDSEELMLRRQLESELRRDREGADTTRSLLAPR